MDDALTRLVTSPRNQTEYDDLFDDLPAYLAPEPLPMFWRCPSCQEIQATVIGEKARCVGCGSMPLRPEPMTEPVL